MAVPPSGGAELATSLTLYLSELWGIFDHFYSQLTACSKGCLPRNPKNASDPCGLEPFSGGRRNVHQPKSRDSCNRTQTRNYVTGFNYQTVKVLLEGNEKQSAYGD
eukprot:m.8840 g.8840  ORF g.8840 m.8840 type:complete len:106 (-) comp4109_c0_seq2:505-822(-)